MIFAQSRRTTPETNTNPWSFAWGFTRSLLFLFQGKKSTNKSTRSPGYFSKFGLRMNLDEFGISGVSRMRFPVRPLRLIWGHLTRTRAARSHRCPHTSHRFKGQFSLSFKGNVCWSVDVSPRKIRKISKKRTNRFIILQHLSEIMPSFVRQDSAVKSIHFIQATRVLLATRHHLSKSYWPKATVILSMCCSQKQRWSVPPGYISFWRFREIN